MGRSSCNIVCRCSGGAVWVEGLKCLRPDDRMLIGEKCLQHEHCVGDPPKTSLCDNGICSCAGGLVPSGKLDDCLPIVNDLDVTKCIDDQQCKQGRPGQFSECSVRNDVDTEKYCHCTSDTTSSASPAGQQECFQKAELIGDPCLIPEQCNKDNIDNSECSGSISGSQCKCMDNYVPTPDGRECAEKRFLGQGCSEHHECSHVINAFCLPMPNEDGDSKMCQCANAYVSPEGSDKQCNLAATQIGEPCEQDTSQCNRVEGATCDESSPSPTCECDPTTHVQSELENKCLRIADKLGDECEEDVQCNGVVPNSECKLLGDNGGRRECLCEDNFIESLLNPRRACVEIVDQLEQPCEESIQCSSGIPGEFSECDGDGSPEQKVCRCMDDTVHTATGHQCYPKVSLINSPCDIHKQCVDIEGGATCAGRKCTCLDDHFPSQCLSKCLKTDGVPLDGECVESAQCVDDNSECVIDPNDGKGICACINDVYVQSEQSHGTCVPIINDLGVTQCVEDIQCTTGLPGDLSHCSKLDPAAPTCQCNDYATSFPGLDYCVSPSGLLDSPCVLSAECSVPNSACLQTFRGTTTCQCEENYIPPKNSIDECNPLATKLGDPCGGSDNQCSLLKNAICDDIAKICSCNEATHVQHSSGQRCLPIVALLGEECKQDNQCQVVHSQCDVNELKCVCKEGYGYVESEINLRKSCVPVVNLLGDSCKEHIQCRQGLPGNFSECTEGKCDCSKYAFHLTGQHKCYEKAALIGTSCEIHEQCENIGEGLGKSECVLGKCSCPSGYVPSLDNKTCLEKVTSLHLSCEETGQCQIQNSACAGAVGSMKCECIAAISLEYGISCLLIINELGSPCSEDIQCQRGIPGEFSKCSVDKDCSCMVDAVHAPGKHHCYQNASKIDGPCQIQEQCEGLAGSVCLSEQCTCTEQAVPSAGTDKCLRKVESLNETCVESDQCTVRNSDCVENPENRNKKECLCSPGLFVESQKYPGTCVEIVDDIGGSCSENIQCTSGIPGELSECIDSNCACRDGAVNPAGEHQCYEKASLIGDSCKGDPVQCDSVPNSVCNPTTKTCECVSEYFVPSSDGRKCLRIQTSVDVPCKESNQCSVRNSKCQENHEKEMRCLCEFNKYVASTVEENKCVEIIDELNRICEEDVQCQPEVGLGEFSECRDARCQCIPGYAYYQPTHHCYSPAPLNGDCNRDEECFVGIGYSARCYDFRKCTCLPGTIESDNLCYARKGVGDYCNRDEECTISIGGPAVCDTSTKICTCKAGHKSDITSSICSGGNILKHGSALAVLLIAVMNVLFK